MIIDTSNSPEPYGIHPKKLKELKEVTCKLVTIIFLIVATTHGIGANIVEARGHNGIVKKREKHKASNYRPVSLTYTLCKILECQYGRNCRTYDQE